MCSWFVYGRRCLASRENCFSECEEQQPPAKGPGRRTATDGVIFNPLVGIEAEAATGRRANLVGRPVSGFFACLLLAKQLSAPKTRSDYQLLEASLDDWSGDELRPLDMYDALGARHFKSGGRNGETGKRYACLLRRHTLRGNQ